MNGPIFVVGANRSGTTLLRLILNAHSRIGIPDELVYFNSEMGGVPIGEWRSPSFSETGYEKFVDRFLLENKDNIEGIDLEAARTVILSGDRDLRRPYEVVLSAWVRGQGKARWGEKTPGNLFYVDVLLEMFPNARFVHVIRDPRAGVNSMQRASFFTNSVVFNAMTREKHHGASVDLLERYIPEAQRITVRYEDLVRDPERAVRALCDFLGEEFEERMMNFHENARRFMRPEAADGFNAAATRPVSTDMLDKWRSELTRREIGIVEALCRREMKAHGYAPLGYSLSIEDRIAMRLRWAYWHLQCWRMRHIRHYVVNYKPFGRVRRRFRRAIRATAPLVLG